MNKESIKGDWNKIKGNIKQKWAELTEDDLAHIEGNVDELIGKIQERYGHAKEVIEKEVEQWRKEHDI